MAWVSTLSISLLQLSLRSLSSRLAQASSSDLAFDSAGCTCYAHVLTFPFAQLCNSVKYWQVNKVLTLCVRQSLTSSRSCKKSAALLHCNVAVSAGTIADIKVDHKTSQFIHRNHSDRVHKGAVRLFVRHTKLASFSCKQNLIADYSIAGHQSSSQRSCKVL